MSKIFKKKKSPYTLIVFLYSFLQATGVSASANFEMMQPRYVFSAVTLAEKNMQEVRRAVVSIVDESAEKNKVLTDKKFKKVAVILVGGAQRVWGDLGLWFQFLFKSFLKLGVGKWLTNFARMM
ncbi:hypothetical protein [Bartonella sp. B30(2025)]